MNASVNRRQFLRYAIAGAASSSLISCSLIQRDTYDYELIVEPASLEILPGKITSGLAYNGQFPAPVIRGKQGQRLRVRVTNKMQEPTTVHWHGIRLDIAMDGVPYLTQPPIEPGETFVYDFMCPDAGSFWYHPHINSLQQLSRGLEGALIIDEADPVDFDEDLVVTLKDWNLNDDGTFKPFTSPRMAFRMGTLGNVKTVNGQQKPIFEIPAGGVVRVRFLNIDNTRVFNLTLKDYPAQVLALDGNPVPTPYPLDVRATGSGMRMDIGLIAPENIGEDIIVYDRKGRFNFEIFRLRTVAALQKQHANKAIPKLPPNPIAAPDLENAEIINFSFGWEGAISPANKEGKAEYKFWTINQRAWEGMSADNIPEPLARLTLGKTYIFDLHNATPNNHPIHLHGNTFTVLSSDQRQITPYHTDTILLEKNERARIAFVADNPGRWMYHCHVIEHMKTGLMGYIEVA